MKDIYINVTALEEGISTSQHEVVTEKVLVELMGPYCRFIENIPGHNLIAEYTNHENDEKASSFPYIFT